jgi:D-sedoheptulose 7-phosphate isomerase
MKHWISDYLTAQKAALESIPVAKVAQLIEMLRVALHQNRHIFVFGNGGSAANASHFVTDLGKGSSDKVGRRFRCLSLNDNVSWMSAIGNDYAYEDIFVRQLENYGQKGDLVLALGVSGTSPNIVKAVHWANLNGRRRQNRPPRHRDRLGPLRARGRRANGDLPHALLRLYREPGLGEAVSGSFLRLAIVID